MSIPLTVNGVTIQFPSQFDKNWAAPVDNWAIAVTNALKPLTGGFLTLSPNPSSGISFANATNTGFLALTVNGSNQLTFNGAPIGASAALTNGHIYVGNVTNNPADVAMTGDVTISNTGVTTLGALKVSDSQIATLAGIAFTKLASTSPYFWYVANSTGVLSPMGVTASRVVITDANGLPSASTVTPTELGYVSGVTSAIQSQFATVNSTFLPVAGGTMSGNISMASNKITALANGSAVGDAVSYGQLRILQVVNATHAVEFDTASASFVTTGLTANITPTSASSKIFIIATGTLASNSNSSGKRVAATISGTTSGDIGGIPGIAATDLSSAGGIGITPCTLTYLDSPGTTATQTYSVKIKIIDSPTTAQWGTGGTLQSITLFEIA